MLRRTLFVACTAGAVVIASPLPALADDVWRSVDCVQNPYPGCELGVGSGGTHQAHPPRERGRSGSGGTSAEDGDDGPVVPKFSNPDLNLAQCAYERSDYTPPPAAVQTSHDGGTGGGGVVAAAYAVGRPVADPKPGEPGAWYVYKCAAGGVRDALYRPPLWIPDGPQEGGGVPLPSPAQLAQVARDQLRLPSPRIEASPVGDQLVHLPTWLWLGREAWGAVSATASVPGVSVIAVARPESVVWSMGDGSTVTCTGPGTPYSSSADPESPSPDCGYTYRTSSAGRPGEAYAVSATVEWTVTWSGAGQSGVFPGLTTTSTADFRVAESQALNSSGG